MLSYNDEKRVREIVHDVTDDIRETVNSTANNVDKILKIVTRVEQELTITKAKVNKHEKRLIKLEKKVGLKSPSESTIFA